MITCLTPSHRSFKLYPILHSTPHYQALGTAAVIQTVSAMGASLHCFLHHSRGNSHAQPESSELLSYLVKQSVHNGILDDRQEAVGRTPLMLAATYGSPASMSVLLSAGANATERDSYNRSVLCMAVVSGDETKVSVALDALTDDDRRRQLEETTCGPVDEFGWSLHRGLLSFPVLTVAVEQDNEAVVNRLIAAGSPLTSEPKGTQPSWV